MSYSYSYSALPQPHSHCLAQPTHCNRNSEWVSFLLKTMNLSEVTACQETKRQPAHTILFLNIQFSIQSPFCLKWLRMWDEPACKGAWCIFSQAGQGTELLPTQQSLPQAPKPASAVMSGEGCWSRSHKVWQQLPIQQVLIIWGGIKILEDK